MLAYKVLQQCVSSTTEQQQENGVRNKNEGHRQPQGEALYIRAKAFPGKLSVKKRITNYLIKS